MDRYLSGDAARTRFSALLDRVEAAYREMTDLPSDEVGNHFRAQMAEQLETQHRLNRALMYRMFGQIADPPDGTAPAPAIKQRLAARLRIPVREVTRRFRTGARLLPRRQLTGPPLPPELPAVTDALTRGTLGEDHLKTITTVLDKLPNATSTTDRDDVETALVRESHTHDADFIAELGKGIDALFNPDGHYDEHDRARRRGLRLGPQGPDGMSTLSGHIDPETRAYLEALTAAVRPGRHRPTAPSTAPPTTAPPPNAATTASNSASKSPSALAAWALIVAIP